MDCNFINQNDIHEKYILDRLNNNEKSEYLEHINTCESCKIKLNSEKQLLGAVRHFGKKEMKSEIARQVAEINSKNINISWDMILKVAAIFFFLVVTPGLVYYYQSIENPADNEYYDLDKVLNQQNETIQVESEEVSESRSKSIEKKDEIIKENSSDLTKARTGRLQEKKDFPVLDIVTKSSEKNNLTDIVESNDYLQSTGGAGAEPSIVTIGNAKASKKRSKKMKDNLESDVLAEEDQSIINYESVPKTSGVKLPESEKFVRPKMFQAVNNEYYKGINLEERSETATESPQTYRMPQKQQQIKTEKGTYSKSLKTNQIYQLIYDIDSLSFAINLVPFYEQSEFYLQNSYPDSFPVIKKKWKLVDITFDWFINEKIRKLNPEEISIYLIKNDFLYVNILNEQFYQVDLKNDSTSAKLIK